MDKEKRGEVFFSGETFRVILFSIGQHKGGVVFLSFRFVFFGLLFSFSVFFIHYLVSWTWGFFCWWILVVLS